MINFLLSLFKPFKSLIEASGANYNQFINILRLKLTLDNRKQSKRNSSNEQSLVLQSFGQIMMGLVFSLISIQIPGEFTFYYIMHTIIMVMMAMMIISEFTTILFDTSENSIIQPLPVNGNTLSLARSAHVFMYLALIAINISVATLVIGIVKFGILSGLLFLVSIFLNVLFTLFLANILYLGLMHIASGEQLKNVLMYFQIAIAILFMAGYQFGLKLIDKTDISNMILQTDWYTYFIPSAVFAGFIEALSKSNFNLTHIIYITEAILVPLIAFFVTSRYLTPVFNRKLLNLENNDKATKVKSGTGKTTLYYRTMENLFTSSTQEKASFQLAWRMSGYERLFKQSFFPSLAYVLIIIAVQFVNDDIKFSTLINSNKYLFFLYSFTLISLTLVNSLMLGANKNAEWVFKILPAAKPDEYFRGFIKAVFARFFSPFYVIISVGVVVLWGIKVIPDVVIVWLAIYQITQLMYYLQPEFPFSQAKAANQGGKNMVKIFGLFIIAGILGWTHYFVNKLGLFGQITLLVFYIFSGLILNKYLAPSIIKWNKLESNI